jgi:tRNA threonylcarbamoyladenosine biosynthesis protein TsaB
MLILAFDTSGMHGSVALLDGPKILSEQALSIDRRSAQTLAPAIVRILAAQGIEPRQINLVATTTGPGSFTGLRVGVTSAKTFAYAVGAEILGLSTLEAIAHNRLSHQPGLNLIPDFGMPNSTVFVEIHAILDAQRKELFLSRFSTAADAAVDQYGLRKLSRLADDNIISADDWLASLKPGTLVAGAGFDQLKDRLPSDVLVDSTNREPRASIVGQLAFRDYQSGRRDDLWKLSPVYLRPSYAEEKARRTPP